MEYISLNPYTEEILQTFPLHSDIEINQFLLELANSFNSYNQSSFIEKSNILRTISQNLELQKEELALLITNEVGKPIAQSRAEIEKCIIICEYYIERGKSYLEPKKYSSNAFLHYEPLGTILIIMPWNYPFWQVFRYLAPGIIAGNTTLLKHSPNVPQCALKIEQIILEAYKTPLLKNVFASNDQVKTIIGSPYIKAISLTGSEKAGSQVAQTAGKYLKKCVLELGGSDPFIVTQSADIEKCTDAAIFSRFQNNGQSCIAAKRFIIHQSVYDQFKTAFLFKMKNLIIGDPMDETTFIGPLARKDLQEELQFKIQDAINKGAMITQTTLIKNKGFFQSPSILENINKNSLAYKEELFGPCAQFYNYESDEEAIQIANDTSFGLSSSIWTNESEQLNYYSNNLKCGAVFINSFSKSDPSIPFGGIKNSGYGKELADLGMYEFMNAKVIITS